MYSESRRGYRNKDSTLKVHAQNLNPPSEETVILKDSGSGTLNLDSLLEKPEAIEFPLWRYRPRPQSFGELILLQHIDAGK